MDVSALAAIGDEAARTLTSMATEATVAWSKRFFLKSRLYSRLTVHDAVRAQLESYAAASFQRMAIVGGIALRRKRALLRDVYVPLTLIPVGGGTSVRVVQGSSYLLNVGARTWISDSAGVGKSTLLQYLWLNEIGVSHTLPILVELRRLKPHLPLLDQIRELVGIGSGDTRDDLHAMLHSGDVRLLFDGLDEVGLDARSRVFDSLARFCIAYRRCPVIISSRPEPGLQPLREFEEFRLAPLAEADARELIRKYDPEGSVADALLSELDKPKVHSQVAEFLTNPLLVSLLYLAYRHKPAVPDVRPLFFRQVFDALFESHDLDKETGYVRAKLSGLNADRFHRVVRSVAMRHCAENTYQFSRDRVLDAIERSAAIVEERSLSASAFLEDLLYRVPLLREDGVEIRWAYRSLAEYFAAEFVARDVYKAQDEVLLSMASGATCARMINVLDLFMDISPAVFRRVIVADLLKRFAVHVAQVHRAAQGKAASAKERDERASVTFGVDTIWRSVEGSRDRHGDDIEVSATLFGARLTDRANGVRCEITRSGEWSLIGMLGRRKMGGVRVVEEHDATRAFRSAAAQVRQRMIALERRQFTQAELDAVGVGGEYAELTAVLHAGFEAGDWILDAAGSAAMVEAIVESAKAQDGGLMEVVQSIRRPAHDP